MTGGREQKRWLILLSPPLPDLETHARLGNRWVDV